MRTLFILLLSTSAAFAQLNISNPFYVAGVLKPASGGGPCNVAKDTENTPDVYQQSFNRYFASMFRAGSSYNLCLVELSLQRNASEDADFQVTIRADSSGSPSGTVLATSETVANASVSSSAFTWVSFSFASPPALTSGSDYWLVITRTDAADGLQVYWEDDVSATVESMKEAANATPTTWTVVSSGAAGMFRTFSQ